MARCQVKNKTGARCKRTAKVCVVFLVGSDQPWLDMGADAVAHRPDRRLRHRHVCNGHRLKDRDRMTVVRVAPIALCGWKKPKQ